MSWFLPVGIVAALCSAVAFKGGWELRAMKAEREVAAVERALSHARVAAEREFSAAVLRSQETERIWNERVQEAERSATQREQDTRAAVDRARRESASLRDNIEALKAGIPGITERAAAERTYAVGKLLGACSEEYRSVAQSADGHLNDVKLLHEAWPRGVKSGG